MHSIGDLIDKLIIENIKIFNLREKINSHQLVEKEYVNANAKMMNLNENRTIITAELDSKIDRVLSGEESNQILKKIKTYYGK